LVSPFSGRNNWPQVPVPKGVNLKGEKLGGYPLGKVIRRKRRAVLSHQLCRFAGGSARASGIVEGWMKYATVGGCKDRLLLILSWTITALTRQLPDSFKKLFGKTAEVLCNFRRLNCIVQSFAHHRQNVVEAVCQIPLGPI